MLSRPRATHDLTRLQRFVPPSARSVWAPIARLSREKADWHNLRRMLASAAGIVSRGGRVGIGSHGDVGGYSFHYEVWLHALGGMPAHEVLRSATIVGATAVGHARDFGSLAPGKLADLQILDKNPLENIHNTASVRYVMKNGRLYRANDLTEIWPRHKPLPPMYLWKDVRRRTKAQHSRRTIVLERKANLAPDGPALWPAASPTAPPARSDAPGPSPGPSPAWRR